MMRLNPEVFDVKGLRSSWGNTDVDSEEMKEALEHMAALGFKGELAESALLAYDTSVEDVLMSFEFDADDVTPNCCCEGILRTTRDH